MIYKIENRLNEYVAGYLDSLSPMPHIHPHLELVYLKDGSSMVTLDNQTHLLEAGDLFLAFPNQIHFYQDQTPPFGFIIIFSPDIFRELKELFHSQTPTSPIIKAPLLPPDLFERMVEIRTRCRSESPFDKIAAKGCLLTLLADLLPLMDLSPNTSTQDSIRNILRYCSENYTEPLTLDILAKNVNLSKYHISHMFKERLNLSFTDFINNLRTEHACQLLKENASVTDAAFSSGFTSIRNFNHVFLKIMGMTPREYLKSQQ